MKAAAFLAVSCLLCLGVSPALAAGQICGTRGKTTCGRGDFCNYSLAARCGYLDHGGRCLKKPQGCARDYRPVCGCDRKTYANACTANAAGASILKNGPC